MPGTTEAKCRKEDEKRETLIREMDGVICVRQAVSRDVDAVPTVLTMATHEDSK